MPPSGTADGAFHLRMEPQLLVKVTKGRMAVSASWGYLEAVSSPRQPTPVFLPGKSHGERSLAGYSPWGPKRIGHDQAPEHMDATHTHPRLILLMYFI